jgi:hypothetical protein
LKLDHDKDRHYNGLQLLHFQRQPQVVLVQVQAAGDAGVGVTVDAEVVRTIGRCSLAGSLISPFEVGDDDVDEKHL